MTLPTDKSTSFASGAFYALALEPDPDRRLRINQVLNSQSLAVQVTYVEDAEHLLGYCAQNPRADLMLLKDVSPHLIRQLRGLEFCRRVPIVVMTSAQTGSGRLDDYYRAGCSFCVRSGSSNAEEEQALRCVLQFWFSFVILPPRLSL